VVGVPSFVWSLSKCNGDTPQAATTPCGQEENVYEDTTGDLTDDVLWNMTATQWQDGKLVTLYDSGTQDYGTWASLGVTLAVGPFDAVFNQDLNFETLGVPTGPNNGNCLANFNYPNPQSSIPFFIIADNRTCANPVAGPVFFTATSQLATPTWTTKNGVTTVKYNTKHTLTQNWIIYLQ